MANNTKVQQPRSVAINNSPIYSTINCKPNFKNVVYILKKRSCDARCSPCYLRPAINGGNPSSVHIYIINGGIPTTSAECYINGGLPSGCYTLSNLDGGDVSEIPQYFVDGEDVSVTPVCFNDFGSVPSGCYSVSILNGADVSAIPQYFVDGQDVSASPLCFIDFRLI